MGARVEAKGVGGSGGVAGCSVVHPQADAVLALVENAEGFELAHADEVFDYLAITH